MQEDNFILDFTVFSEQEKQKYRHLLLNNNIQFQERGKKE